MFFKAAATCLLFGSVFFLPSSSYRATFPGPIINTLSGPVQGLLEVYKPLKTILTFRGIRYARPPVGNLRFREAVPPEPWNRTFRAWEYGPQCAQLDGFSLEFQGEEDCLVLNLATPVTLRKKSPVVVNVHGGGLHGGNGENFIKVLNGFSDFISL